MDNQATQLFSDKRLYLKNFQRALRYFLVMSLSLISFCSVHASSEQNEYRTEATIESLETDKGEAIAKSLLTRRREQGANFSMGELADVVSNMINALINIEKLANEDQIFDIHKRRLDLDDLAKKGYPYRLTLESLSKANITRDFIYNRFYQVGKSKNVSDDSCPTFFPRFLPNVKIDGKSYNSIYGYKYPDSWTTADIDSIDIRNDAHRLDKVRCHRGSGVPNEMKIFNELLSRDDLILLPTFNPLSLDFFINSSPYPVFPLGLARGYRQVADGLHHSAAMFFDHDLFHASLLMQSRPGEAWSRCSKYRQNKKRTWSDDTDRMKMDEIVIKNIYHNLKNLEGVQTLSNSGSRTYLKEELTRALQLLLFQFVHESHGCSPIGLTSLENADYTLASGYVTSLPELTLGDDWGFGFNELNHASYWMIKISEYLKAHNFEPVPAEVLTEIYNQIATNRSYQLDGQPVWPDPSKP